MGCENCCTCKCDCTKDQRMPDGDYAKLVGGYIARMCRVDVTIDFDTLHIIIKPPYIRGFDGH